MKLIPFAMLSILVFAILLRKQWSFLTKPERDHLLRLKYKALSLAMIIVYFIALGALGWLLLNWHGLVGGRMNIWILVSCLVGYIVANILGIMFFMGAYQNERRN